MQTTKNLLVLTLCLMVSGLSAPTALAHQQSLVSESDIEDALRGAIEEDEAQRDLIRSTLASDEVGRLAAELGLDAVILREASAAVDTLEGEELAEVASRAADLRDGLAGGVTVTISLVALLLIIIIVILLV